MESQVTTDDGVQLWTARIGTGPPLVLCHGGPGLWDYFEPVGDLLREAALVVRWDQRGCGRSQRAGPYTVDRFLADLDSVREDLGQNAVDLLGHSWGALLALRYALRHPGRVNRLIYACGTGVDPGSPWRPEFHRNLYRRLSADALPRQGPDEQDRTPAEDRRLTVCRLAADFVDPGTAIQHAERMTTPWFGINAECADAINSEVDRYLREHDVLGFCRRLEVPVLIIDGEHDLRPRWAVDSLHRALPAVRRVTLTGAGHSPWVEDPSGFRTAVAEFLADRDTG